jgi:hypothetical protein
MQAYVHRPLGPTRRLEGLVGAVEAVDSALCETDLEALVLEEREIRHLQPRFNTVRQQHMPRLWLRLPPVPAKRRAPRRLELCAARESDAAEYLGPFRNEAAARHARQLARAVFELDACRRGQRELYERQLLDAWTFLQGDVDAPLARVQQRQRAAAAAADGVELRRCERLLAAVGEYDVTTTVLPADPRTSRYAVVRPSNRGVEGLLLDRGMLVRYYVMEGEGKDATRFAAELLTPDRPRTAEEDVAVVLRWLGAQKPSARMVLVDGVDEQRARDAIENAATELAAGQAPSAAR